jgi:RNA polymerase sigma-70 factor (ECF subfamily)
MNSLTSVMPRQSVPEYPRDAEMTLLESAREMNTDALIKIFDHYSPALYNYAFRLCNDNLMADNIVGDVFAKLLDQFSVGNGPNTNLRSYLYEVTYHLVVDEFRNTDRESPLEVVDFTRSDGYSSSISLENRIFFETIMMAIKTELTDDQRHVVILRFLEGFSLRETAMIIGKKINYVKVIQNRAIAALRKVLELKAVK